MGLSIPRHECGMVPSPGARRKLYLLSGYRHHIAEKRKYYTILSVSSELLSFGTEKVEAREKCASLVKNCSSGTFYGSLWLSQRRLTIFV